MNTPEPRPIWVGISDGPSGTFVVGAWTDVEVAKAESRAVADPDSELDEWRDDGQAGWVSDSETAESALYVQATALVVAP